MRKYLTGESFKSIEEAERALEEPATTVQLQEGQRQAVILALALLSIERPGWLPMIEQIALKMDNLTEDNRPQMFSRLREIHMPT